MFEPASLKAVHDVLGGVDEVTVRQASRNQLADIGSRLRAEAIAAVAPAVANDEYRVAVPAGDGHHLRGALLFAHSVVMEDPIDAVFADSLSWFASAGSLIAKRRFELAAMSVNELVRHLGDEQETVFRRLLADEDSAGIVRGQLVDAVRFCLEWVAAIESQALILVSARHNALAALSHPVFARTPTELPVLHMGQALELLPPARGMPSYFAYRDDVYNLNSRMSIALAGNGQLAAQTALEWVMLCNAIGASRGGTPTVRSVEHLMSVELPALSHVSPATLSDIRTDVDAFETWRRSLRVVLGALPSPSEDPGSVDLAAEILNDELAPRIAAIKADRFVTRLKQELPKEASTLTVGTAGLMGLGEVLTVTPAAFAALPLATAGRLLVNAALAKGTGKKDSVLAKLVRG